MKNRPKPTPQDVARLLNGEIDNIDDVNWIMDWRERDPDVEKWFYMLDVEDALGSDAASDDIDEDSSLSAVESQYLKDVFRSRITALDFNSRGRERLQDEGVGTGVVRFDATNRSSFEVSLDAEKPGRGLLCMAGMTDDVVPLNLVIANLWLTEGDLSPCSEKLEPKWDVHVTPLSLQKKITFPKNKSQPVALGAAGVVASGDNPTHFSAKLDKPMSNVVRVHCPARADRKPRLVIVECDFQTEAKDTTITWSSPLFLQDLVVENSVEHVEGKIAIPRPRQAEALTAKPVTVNVRAVTENDLTNLESSVASRLLANHSPCYLHLHRANEGLEFSVDEIDREVIKDQQATWMLRWAANEGEVANG